MDGFLNGYATIVNNVLKHIAPKVSPADKSEYLKYMNKIEHNERIYTDTGITGLGMAEIIPDGAIGASDAPIQGFTKNYTQVLFTKKVRISYLSNYFLFDSPAAKIKAEVKRKVVDGKNAIEQAKSYLGQSLLANGWGTSFVWQPINNIGSPTLISTLGADGVEYWSTAHPREDGGPTWNNVIIDGLTPSPVFSYSSLLAARRQFALIKDGRGNPMEGAELDTLVCRRGSNTAQLAKTIKGTIDKGLAPQQLNIFNNAPATDTFKIIELEPWGQLGLTGLMWFMTDSKMKGEDYGFQYIEALATRAEPVFYDAPGNQDFVSNFNSIAIMGASDLRSWMASAGDGSTT